MDDKHKYKYGGKMAARLDATYFCGLLLLFETSFEAFVFFNLFCKRDFNASLGLLKLFDFCECGS